MNLRKDHYRFSGRVGGAPYLPSRCRLRTTPRVSPFRAGPCPPATPHPGGGEGASFAGGVSRSKTKPHDPKGRRGWWWGGWIVGVPAFLLSLSSPPPLPFFSLLGPKKTAGAVLRLASRAGPTAGSTLSPTVPFLQTHDAVRGLTDSSSGAVVRPGDSGVAAPLGPKRTTGRGPKTTGRSRSSELKPQRGRGRLALAVLRAPPGAQSQLSFPLRGSEGGSMSPPPACPRPPPRPGLDGMERPDGFSFFKTSKSFDAWLSGITKKQTLTTLSGGSLGSCVDEERS